MLFLFIVSAYLTAGPGVSRASTSNMTNLQPNIPPCLKRLGSVIESAAEVSVDGQKSNSRCLPTALKIWHSEDRTSWYMHIMKANGMHYFSDLFHKVLYMFRTGPLSIIRRISTLYTRNRTRMTKKFMVTPCINNIQHLNNQLMYTTLKNVELL